MAGALPRHVEDLAPGGAVEVAVGGDETELAGLLVERAFDAPFLASKLNASLTWDYAQFTSTLFAVRYGSVTNAAGSGRLSPWTVFNASARYRLNERASVGLTVNNLLDQIKEDDSDGWPYYPTGNYDAMGRQWWLDFSYHFGG